MTRNTLYIMSAVMMIGWVAGFFFMNADMRIHILLVFSLLFYLRGLMAHPAPKASSKI